MSIENTLKYIKIMKIQQHEKLLLNIQFLRVKNKKNMLTIFLFLLLNNFSNKNKKIVNIF